MPDGGKILSTMFAVHLNENNFGTNDDLNK